MNGVTNTPVCLSEGNNDASRGKHASDYEVRVAGMRNLRRLSDLQWERISTVLPGRVGKRARNGNGRDFLEAVLWIADNQASWSDVPKVFGDSHAVYIRFARWAHDGVWPRVISELQELPELNARLSALVRAYVDARTVRQLRSSMKGLNSGLLPAK